MRYEEIPLGPDHPVEEKIKWADALFEGFGQEILAVSQMAANLNDYKRSIRASWQAMEASGVVAECTWCAVEDGGSCCGRGIEDKFEVITLLLNLVFGRKLPERPLDPSGCWFLGESGCLLFARHVICVNFMCKRLYEAIDAADLHRVQQAMQEETDVGFMIEERLKSWMARYRA